MKKEFKKNYTVKTQEHYGISIMISNLKIILLNDIAK